MDSNFSNTKVKDSSAKLIFEDATLCAQFLRGYVDIPLLKNVQPEDIEDVTERYVHMFTEERNSDIVKRVRIQGEDSGGDKIPFYLISLIEHKSEVDYNVIMQVIRYMVFIWEDYEREMEKRQEGVSRTKSFRYPPILPVVFYDGVQKWTSAGYLHDRVLSCEALREYIPDFRYLLVELKDYSNFWLMEQRNELSLVMLIDKLQDAADLKDLTEELDAEYMREALEGAPEYLLDIISKIAEVLLAKLNVPAEEAEAFTGQIKERHMGELLAHFKGYDVQAIRREAREEGIQKLILFCSRHHISKQDVQEELIEQYSLNESEALRKIEKYWQQ